MSAYFRCPSCNQQIPTVMFDQHREEHLDNPFCGYFPKTIKELETGTIGLEDRQRLYNLALSTLSN